ncbi:hypothetical protein P3X46_005406 [Hevea brasiliensis]|uniref:Uncharacterized protein n=1 Tax=Hevea brasiliensis TaxID=3981 RepID=A0ABQ9N3K7_HEVBR|nr:hypothetical protein P3X46_005406 [Hevea brasiliensis]
MSCRLLIVSLLFASCFQEMLGARPLEGEKNFVIQSLRGPVTPSHGSCTTYVPGGKCTLGEKNFAGKVSHVPSPPVFTEVAANFAVASVNKQDASS